MFFIIKLKDGVINKRNYVDVRKHALKRFIFYFLVWFVEKKEFVKNIFSPYYYLATYEFLHNKLADPVNFALANSQ